MSIPAGFPAGVELSTSCVCRSGENFVRNLAIVDAVEAVGTAIAPE